MPHTLIGIGALGFLVFLLLEAVFAGDIPGVVTGFEISHSSKGGESYILKYQYQVGEQSRSGSSGVNRAVYERLRAQDEANPQVTVRHFSIGPFERSTLREGGGVWPLVGFLTLWVAFWDSVVSVFVFHYWIKPLRLRWLYKHGEATSGTLIGKRVQSGKSPTYYVSYNFSDPLSGKLMTAETQVWNAADWNLAREQQAVTVLCAPDNPKRSTVYEFGGYKVDLDLRARYS